MRAVRFGHARRFRASPGECLIGVHVDVSALTRCRVTDRDHGGLGIDGSAFGSLP